MKRRQLVATVLLVIVVELLITVPLILFTRPGKNIVAVINSTPTPTPTPRPILTVNSTPPAVSAKSAFLMDATTGRTLMNVNGNARLPMASTTKIMTCIIALQKVNPNKIITIGQDAVNEPIENGGSSAGLVAGDKMPMIDLLYALMLPSGDDAAIAVADGVSGSTASFVTLMNQYAVKLGLTNTHYVNPDGLPYDLPGGNVNPQQYSSAADLAKLTAYAMQNETFSQIVNTQEFDLSQTSDYHAYTWDNTNKLLQVYPGAIGVKTGSTGEAGNCLVFAAKQNGQYLIGALLDDGAYTGTEVATQSRFTDAAKMLAWGFSLPLLPPPSPTVILRNT
ncbi:D-alanyl-D-alanine carboxypeptidase [Ktedonobacteria bacterium brp13]|nr:D-alanyl-D-alanine carboxypeptidase [Ktedonobacteria bacterium brp13]